MDRYIKPITINDIHPKNTPKSLNLFLRGFTFRTTLNDQENCIKSIFKTLLNDLSANKVKIKVILTTYKNNKNYLFIKFIEKFFKGKIIDKRLDANIFKSQSDSFIETLRIANNFKDTSLITRADLIFIKKIPLNRLDKKSFLFQWKHFHDFKIKEVPDQLHFIGMNQIKNIYKVCKNNKNKLGLLPDKTGYYTLHNLYNILSENNINSSYIFNFKNVTYKGTYCNLRGNSHYTKIPHFYKYTTPAPKKTILKKLRGLFFN